MSSSPLDEEHDTESGEVRLAGLQLPEPVARTALGIRRAVDSAGPERETALLVIKSVVAATVAWYLAAHVLAASQPTFAAFSALLTVQVSVAQSLETLLRYSAAVLLGVGLVGASVLPVGPQLWIFAVVILVAVGVGRWRALGSYGIQVAVVTVFAYGTYATSGSTDSGLSHLAGLVGMVLVGTGVGVATSLVVAPPLRYRGAEHAVRALVQSVTSLLNDMATGIDGRIPDQEEAAEWWRRADELPDIARQARYTIEHAAEVTRVNPRRLLMRGSSTFEGYRVIANTIDRLSAQVVAVTKGIDRASRREDGSGAAYEHFLDDYQQLLSCVADATDHLGRLHTARDLDRDQEFPELVQGCRQAHQRLVEDSDGVDLDQPSQWAIYGGLHIDAERLVDELESARDELAKLSPTLRTPGRTFVRPRKRPTLRPRSRPTRKGSAGDE